MQFQAGKIGVAGASLCFHRNEGWDEAGLMYAYGLFRKAKKGGSI